MRRSSTNVSRLQEIHDAAVALGAACSHAPRRSDLSALHKYNPDWEDQPRVSVGNPDGGQWTGAGTADEVDDSTIGPTAARANDTQAKKERFVDAHLAEAEKGAEQLGVPVENILGLSALESDWGTHRFAIQGNNYFGIHYPAPFANGQLTTVGGRTKVASFASYADSLRSFIALSGSIVHGKVDPKVFAAALQASGKFGIDPETGAKVPTYVDSVARTIMGLRAIVARRRI